jgi:hypothetical protein
MDFWITGLTAPVALAAVALLGYLVGRHRTRVIVDTAAARRKLHQARTVISAVETISRQLRRNLATHHSTVCRYRDQISALGDPTAGSTPHTRSEEIHQMLVPTEQLSRDIAVAYDEIRQHTRALARLKAW